jgi:hypothetical protein
MYIRHIPTLTHFTILTPTQGAREGIAYPVSTSSMLSRGGLGFALLSKDHETL